MFKTIQESFKITNGNIVIATPLIFFSIISSLYLIFSSGGSKLSLIFSIILFFLMFGAFLSGWFYMITKALRVSDVDDSKLITEFPSGVGEYFLNSLGMILMVIFVSVIILAITVFVGAKLIGDVGILPSQFVQATSSVAAMKDFVESLNQEQLIKLNAWNLLLFISMQINYFVIMLYPPTIFFKEKNPFKAFVLSMKDTFSRKFFKNILIFLITSALYFIISLITAFAGNNILVHFIMTLLNFYYATFAAVLIFNYYYSNFAKIGSNIDATV